MSKLALEDGGFLLLEDGGYLLLDTEGETPTSPEDLSGSASLALAASGDLFVQPIEVLSGNATVGFLASGSLDIEPEELTGRARLTLTASGALGISPEPPPGQGEALHKRGGASLERVLKRQRRIDELQAVADQREQTRLATLRQTIQDAFDEIDRREEQRLIAEQEEIARRRQAEIDAEQARRDKREFNRTRVIRNRQQFERQLNQNIDQAFHKGQLRNYEGMSTPDLLRKLRKLKSK